MTITDLPALTEDYLRPYTGHTLELYGFYLDRFYGWCAQDGTNPTSAVRSYIERYPAPAGGAPYGTGQRVHRPDSCPRPLPVRPSGVPDRPRPRPVRQAPRITSMPRDTLGLNRSQMQAFLLAGHNSGGRYYAAAYLVACMALRPAEACSIRVEDYQKTIRGHRVLEFHGKGGAPARMPIPVPVIRALDAAADGRSSGNLLLRLDGGDLTRQGLGTITNTLGRRAGISEVVRPHLLRHSCITNALESGASIRKVIDLARHTEPRTTMRYDRNRTSQDDHAIHTLVAYLAPTQQDD